MPSGSAPSLRRRRKSDSDALRYCVGRTPCAANARRHAWISGSALSPPAAGLARAVAVCIAVWAAGRTTRAPARRTTQQGRLPALVLPQIRYAPPGRVST
jgi:hypothetical protein